MDAQNAADTDQTKRAGSPSKQPEKRESSDPKSPKSILKVKPELPANEIKADTPVNTGAGDHDSDAETVVLPGKDGYSPSKVRKVRQEDRSDHDGDGSKDNGPPRKRDGGGEHHASAGRIDGISRDIKKKRPSNSHEKEKERSGLSKDGSSGLSSAPTSPRPQPQARRRRSLNSSLSLSDSEDHRQKAATSKSSLREKFKSGERLLPHKRKAPRTESDDEDDNRKPRRPRTISATMEMTRPSKDHRAHPPKSDAHHRSTSPPHRTHRRSVSTQLPSQSSNGSGLKKKRLPAPLQPPEDISDESSASGSPHLRNAKLRSLTTPSTTESLVSPAKALSHKKHLDAHGQTLLARACARGEYDAAKFRLKDRPEDLNVADYAGNTPLQIAAINGCEDIVQLLIEAGCNLDCVNYDKDTPLLDAVDNGHLGVVKLLLNAGVNPRKANVNGEEPIDRVTEETDNADEIRAALIEAKKRFGGRTKTSEDRHSHHDPHEQRDSHAPESPRQLSTQASNRRGGTVRSTKTRNDLLYMPLDDKTLRQAAGRGDEETVARILQVKDNCDDAESMVAAARGGHDLVMQLLLGLGGAKADPEPVPSQPEEFATPILAAIGQENLNVVELLLEQQNFDPTKRFKGETYYEIAKRRQGTNWKEEEQLLKNAYDAHKNSHKSKLKSPGKRGRDREREEKRARREEKSEGRPSKRRNSSPTVDGEHRKKPLSAKLPSPRERKKSDPQPSAAEETRLKRGPVRTKEEKLSSVIISDREASPSISQKSIKAKRAESDLAAMSSEGETAKPRRKLISKGELRGERDKRDKHRRPSMVSNASFKEPSSPHDSRHDDSTDKQKLSEKYHDRAKALKRDESKDRPIGSSDGTGKRHRASLTPDRSGNGDKEETEKPAKRQRLDGEALERKQKRLSSDEHVRKSGVSHEGSKLASKSKRDSEESKASHVQRERKDSNRSNQIQDSIQIKSEDIDVEMINVDQGENEPRSDDAAEDKDAENKKAAIAKKVKEEEERQRAEAEEEKKRQEEKRRLDEKKRQAEAEAARKSKEAEEAEKKKKLEEQKAAEKKRQEEEEVQRRAEEKARQEAEERARQEAEEARRKQEEEEEKERKRQAEEQKRREEEEARLRKEREALEEARRKEEEEQQRKEREHRERIQREEMERKRAAREAEQRKLREEQDRARLDKLPPLLRWLDTCSNPKTPYFADKFKTMQGVRYDCINPSTNRTEEGREQWVLNTHVALLLGEKDLSLSRYTSWERASVSELAKTSLWRIENGLYSLTIDKMLDLGQELPGYYGEEDATRLSHNTIQRLRKEAWDRFRELDMFFVKVSDLLYTIPTIPHLHNLKIAVTYRELLETEEQARFCRPMQKWKQDPDADRFGGHFAPRNKYYVDGRLVGEDKPVRAETSKTPFPDPPRVPRRGGLASVMPDESDYERLCMEQGLEHLVNGKQSPSLPNGVHTPPASHADAPAGIFSTEAGETKVQSGTQAAHETHHSTTNGGGINGINGSA